MWERPGLPTAMARAQAGERIDDLLDEIAELQRHPKRSLHVLTADLHI